MASSSTDGPLKATGDKDKETGKPQGSEKSKDDGGPKSIQVLEVFKVLRYLLIMTSQGNV